MAASLKVEQQDGDGQEERVQPSPLTAEEWDGPSKTAVQSRLNTFSIFNIGNTLDTSNFAITCQLAVIINRLSA